MKEKLLITPYEGLGIFRFEDNLETILDKSRQLIGNEVSYSTMNELGRDYLTVYLDNYRLLIVLYEKGLSVRYFEIKDDVYDIDVNLYREEYNNLCKYYTEQDKDIIVDNSDNTFDTPKFGFSMVLEASMTNSILIYSKKYKLEPPVTPDDILAYLDYTPLKD